MTLLNVFTERPSISKAGNAGLIITTGGNDLCHTLPVASFANGAARSAVITKITAYNNTGANVTLSFGTLDRTPAGGLFVALLPLRVAINGLDNEWLERQIPAVEFISWPQPTAAGRIGDIYVLASAALVVVQIEVKEFG